jgi:hypothetical protein
MGNKRRVVRDLAFTGNYTTGGESLTPTLLGLRTVETVSFAGPAMSTDLVTMNPVSYNHATSKVLQYESAATGLAQLEKTSAEAYATGSAVRVTAIGT